MKKKLLSVLLSVALVTSLATGCSSKNEATTGTTDSTSEKATETTEDTTYNELYSSEVSTLNYLVTSTLEEMKIPANTIDTLVETDSDGNLVPCLATEWSQSEDGLVWTFKLREGVKWVDSTGAEVAEVTAQDFVDAMKYILTPENEAANAQNLFSVIANAEEYYKGAAGITDEEGKTWGPIDFSEVGVKAVDTYTLEYTLGKEVPYFLSSLVYVIYMPAYGPLLEEQGTSFATSNTSMYYCGGYYLSEFVPQEKQVLTKNSLYWDADKVFITDVTRIYNAEAETLAPEMVKRGEVDYADISSDILDDWLANEDTASFVSKERPATDYSYFYCFNFNPTFDDTYEPENWKLAVNNENFRQAMMAALNRFNPVAISEPNTPDDYIMNTITPTTFTQNADGIDYTALAAFSDIQASDSFDEAAAATYKEAATAELTAAGATFPIKVLMKYNPSTTNWDKECAVVEQQMESVLGTDFIDIIVEAGPSDSFLSEVRRSGDYAFMKCGWGADYADPETWTDPFYQAEGDLEGYQYAFLRNAIEEGTASSETVQNYFNLVETAKTITTEAQKNERYDAFAEAERYLIDHALVIPYGISISKYISIKYNVFDKEYASCGSVPNYRYKGVKMLDNFVSLEDYKENSAK
ncbi:MAG: extracellular solute-binding protein family 5 [Anaerocolumna sp.]|jgi:oligopeptide transport system substrate-binding protein|nr:extracellular solute-binding protein family 5 [Anaerocolumna sp.]